MQPFDAGVRYSQFLAAAVGAQRRDADKAFAFERQDVAAERGAVHHEIVGQRIDRHRAQPLELGENRELGRAQARRRQVLVVKLGNVPRRLADGQAVALFRPRQHVRRRHEFLVLDIRSICA